MGAELPLSAESSPSAFRRGIGESSRRVAGHARRRPGVAEAGLLGEAPAPVDRGRRRQRRHQGHRLPHVPCGILRRAGVADVVALGTGPGPGTLYPARKVEPQATVAEFDARHGYAASGAGTTATTTVTTGKARDMATAAHAAEMDPQAEAMPFSSSSSGPASLGRAGRHGPRCPGGASLGGFRDFRSGGSPRETVQPSPPARAERRNARLRSIAGSSSSPKSGWRWSISRAPRRSRPAAGRGRGRRRGRDHHQPGGPELPIHPRAGRAQDVPRPDPGAAHLQHPPAGPGLPPLAGFNRRRPAVIAGRGAASGRVATRRPCGRCSSFLTDRGRCWRAVADPTAR